MVDKRVLRGKVEKLPEFGLACRGLTLEEIWNSNEVDKVKKEFMEVFQQVVNNWASEDGKKHIPVHVSLKPKKKLEGSYFPKKKEKDQSSYSP